MLNLILGILIGIAGSWLVVQPRPVPWFSWVLFTLGAVAVVFAFDVLVGSHREHQRRAAWMGLSMFGGLGVVMILAGWGLVL